MAILEWDKVEDRTFETGLSHGVLYQPVRPGVYANGVVWNGLVGVEEQFTDDLNEGYYFDGVKYLDSFQFGDFAATLRAYTYPDEFLTFEGIDPLGDGLYVDVQDSKLFGMSYQTVIGNAVDGTDAGYQIHLLYNLTVVEDVYNYQNGSNLPSVIEFRWTVNGMPEAAAPFRPTSHLIVDSRYIHPDLLEVLEGVIYGTDSYEIILDGLAPGGSGPEVVDGGTPASSGEDIIDGNRRFYIEGTTPRLPSLENMLGLILEWNPKLIIATPSTGLSPLDDAMGDLTSTALAGVYAALPAGRLEKTDEDGLNTIAT